MVTEHFGLGMSMHYSVSLSVRSMFTFSPSHLTSCKGYSIKPCQFIGIPSGCQTDWIQIRPDILSGLIWVQTVCKNYQQTTLGDKGLKDCLPLLGHIKCCLLIFFKINFFEKFFQEYHLSVKQIGSRSGPTFCRA